MPKQHPNGAASEDNSPVVFSVTEKQLYEVLLQIRQDIKALLAETEAYATPSERRGTADTPARGK